MTTDQILKSTTYRQKMGDFRAMGKWTWVNSFSFVITAIVNDKPKGHLTGQIMGKNLAHCAVCNTGIIHHYTLRNEKEGDLNVGVECLGKILDEKQAEVIKKTIASIQRQVKVDIVRPIKTAQLQAWLDKNWAGLSDKRNQRIDAELKANPKLYWDKPRKIVGFDYVAMKQIERDATDEELSRYAPSIESRDRTFWAYNHDNFVRRSWNPDTMKKVYVEECKKEGIKMDFKWRELTDEENQKISEITHQKIQNYIARLRQ